MGFQHFGKKCILVLSNFEQDERAVCPVIEYSIFLLRLLLSRLRVGSDTAESSVLDVVLVLNTEEVMIFIQTH